jgi:hypothetical protein
LEWVLENWSTEGCDLWEEVRSNDFYFNRMAYLYSLNVAADFGDMIGQSGGDAYRKLAETIKVSLDQQDPSKPRAGISTGKTSQNVLGL